MRYFAFVLFILCVGCSSVSRKALNKQFSDADERFQDHIGFALYDPAEKKWLYDYHANRYFTPASNTKIFTFFTSLSILGDSIPALRYVLKPDSLIFWGTGDPSLLYKEIYQNGRVLTFLQQARQPLYYCELNYQATPFGAGWAWDDYNDYYSAERSAFPVYGNLVSIKGYGRRFVVQPSYMRQYIKVGNPESRAKLIRRHESNEFTYHPRSTGGGIDAHVPFKSSPELTTALLSDTLKKMVRYADIRPTGSPMTLYSVPADTLYRVMMQDSDNFIAEQLLLMCSQVLSDSLSPEIAIRYAKKNLLHDLLDEPIWVDGSGLSRYNLFTPRSIVQLWEKIYNKVPRERLFALLATGGRYGTIKNWYKADSPYIFGKTGTLSNNHSLSGYLVTKKGKTLIFSFMNSNYVSSTNDVRREMEKILKMIYEKY